MPEVDQLWRIPEIKRADGDANSFSAFYLSTWATYSAATAFWWFAN